MLDMPTEAAAQLALAAAGGEALEHRWHELEDQARIYALASKAASTRRAYRGDLEHFRTWCEAHDAEPLPADPVTICLYLTELAATGAKAATLRRRLVALSQAHKIAGLEPSPTADARVRATMAGIRRTHGTAPAQKAPAVTAELRRLLSTCDRSTLAGARDAALLLVGFAGGFRRSELVALDAEDVTETEDGLRTIVRRSKTDPEARGREIGLPWGAHPETCPVRALRAWRELAGIERGPLFPPIDRHGNLQPGQLTPQSVALIVKRACRGAGLDPARYAGHSLRSGLATSAAQGGAPERAIMRQTGHRSVDVLRSYIRAGTLFQENAAAYAGL